MSEVVVERPLPPQLADALRHGPFDRALRAAIAHRGLSLARVRAHLRRLGVDAGLSTLSYWQRGQRRPEAPGALDTVRALESVLGVPDGSLVALVGPRRRHAGRVAAPDVWTRHSDLLARFELTGDAHPNDGLELAAAHDYAEVGADRALRRLTTRAVVSALRPGPDRYFAVFAADPGGRVVNGQVRAGEGCRVGRVRALPTAGLLAAELLFDRRLVAGETHVFRYAVSGCGGAPSPGVERAFTQPVDSYLAQLEFHRRAVPARCTRQHLPATGRDQDGPEDLQCWLGRLVSAYFTDLGPGTARIAVQWD